MYNELEHNVAIIIGGGIAGLLGARVLCRHFKKVTIIEKDKYPSQAGPRNGTPQSNHVHVLLIKGKEILLNLFPEIERKLVAKGAHIVNLTNDVNYYVGTGYSINFESVLTTIACTRQLLEHEIRNEISRFPNVTIRQNTKATGLMITKDKETELRICKGVTVYSADTNSEETITGDLVVDTSGRESKIPKWLEQLGYDKPKKTVVNSYIGYSTCWFKRTVEPTTVVVDDDNDDKLIIKPTIILTKPPSNPYMGIMYPVEGSLWLVGILGIGKNYPPTDKQGFLEYTKKLETLDIYNAIKDFELSGPIYGYRTTGSRQYHYERMKTWPENLVIYGDSVSSFNPFYGQGITVACIEAVTLDKTLRVHKKINRDLLGFSTIFQKKISKINTLPWLLGTSEDFRWPSTEGIKPDIFTRYIQKYSHRVLLLTPKSKIAAKSFFEVMQLLRSPLILFHPLILIHIVIEALKGTTSK